MQAFSPTGHRIIGTSDTIPATATIRHDSFIKRPDGSIDFDYSGETDVFWDGQETSTRDGKILFEDEVGAIWTEDQIVLKDENAEATP